MKKNKRIISLKSLFTRQLLLAIRKIIRALLALVFFDLFKKRQIWKKVSQLK